MSKKISVIIPVYNRETLIARAINSCIDQTLNKSLFEIIVINDGSTDKSKYEMPLLVLAL